MTVKRRPESEESNCHMTDQPEDPRTVFVKPDGVSETLNEIVVGPSETFFKEFWQQKCNLFRYASIYEQSRPDQAQWNDHENPLKALVSNGWPVLVDLMEQGRNQFDLSLQNDITLAPLIFRDQECLSQPNAYSNNLNLAYLDGCSLVLNHADTLNGFIARLCEDLQRSFPHAYANAYITPPASKAVPPHADDRDVLVIQLVGRKHWKVYERVPIPFPFPHEQVGKEGLPIPPAVLSGPCTIDDIIQPGDVLYMPRGFVHEAATLDDDLSFHVTIALATHDWTLAGTMRDATANILTQVVDYRMALPVTLGQGESEDDRKQLQIQINEAFERLRQEVTAESVCQHLRTKYAKHNHSKYGTRKAAMERAKSSAIHSSTSLVVGREAAATMTLSTQVRGATPTEKASLPPPPRPQGLHVRAEAADAILAIVQRLKTEEGLRCCVKDLLGLLSPDFQSTCVCELTLLGIAKCCVELGAFAIIKS